MARDQTPEEMVETTLYHAGVGNSGEVAAAIIEGLREEGLLVEDKPDVVTPTQGDMSQQDHTAFILRIFMYWVERQAAKQVTVDLRDVMARTRGRQLQVALQGHVFEARTIADLTLPTDEERRMMQ